MRKVHKINGVEIEEMGLIRTLGERGEWLEKLDGSDGVLNILSKSFNKLIEVLADKEEGCKHLYGYCTFGVNDTPKCAICDKPKQEEGIMFRDGTYCSHGNDINK